MNAIERIREIEKSLGRMAGVLAPDSPTGGEYQFLLHAFKVMRRLAIGRRPGGRAEQIINEEFEEAMKEGGK